MKAILRAATSMVILLTSPAWADDLADEITGYMDFATYDSGIIVPEQLTQDVFEAAVFIDTRDSDQFDAATIPGATHIEWRDVPSGLEDIPDSGMVILFCNTGSLSAQAVFAARVLGHENVLVLQTGMQGWLQNAAYKP